MDRGLDQLGDTFNGDNNGGLNGVNEGGVLRNELNPRLVELVRQGMDKD